MEMNGIVENPGEYSGKMRAHQAELPQFEPTTARSTDGVESEKFL